MAEDKNPQGMHLGELVDAMIRLRFDIHYKLKALGTEGSDYHSIEELRSREIVEHNEKYKLLVKELRRKETMYQAGR